MSSAFIVLAAALALFAAALVAIPLLASRANGSAATPWTALTAAALVVGAAVILYPTWSNWTWPPASTQLTPAAMVGRLARQLEREPNNLQGWLQLGRSYSVMNLHPLAIRAYGRADRLAGGQNVEALLGLAESLTMENEAALDGKAAGLYEKALALDPSSAKALFFGGVAAQRRGELALARERYSRLLALDPPDNVRPVIEAQIAALDKQVGPASQGPPVAVNVRISVAPAVAASTTGGAALFVMIRDPAQPGPPLAARRLAAQLPQTVQLTQADAMLEGRSFRKGQVVQVVARVARGGTAMAQSGDPYGEIRYEVGKDGLREILIDRLTP